MDFVSNGMQKSSADRVELFDERYGQFRFPVGDSPEAVVGQFYPTPFDAMEVAASEPNHIPDVNPPGQTQDSSVVISNFTEYPPHQSGQIGVFNEPMVNSPEYMATTEPYQEPCQLPPFKSMIKWEPIIDVNDVPESIRFRYESEIKTPIACTAPEKSRNPIKIKVDNYQGQLNILIDLVVEGSYEPHINEIYLPKDVKNWSKRGKYLMMKVNQSQTNQTYELPWYGVMRAKKDRPNGNMSARGTPDNDDHNKRTTRVVFRFTFEFPDIDQTKQLVTNVVRDSKSSDSTGETKLVHMNPTTCRCNDQAEVTILGDNIMAKSKVYFKSATPVFHKEASVVYRHKKQAIVVKVPQYCTSDGGKVEVFVISGSGQNENISNRLEFTFKAETEVRIKRQAQNVVSSEEAKNKLRRMIQSKNPQPRAQSFLQVDSCVDDCDEVDCSSEVPEEEESEEESEMKSLVKIAFEVADSAIPNYERLCQILAQSEAAMLSVNSEGYTPLAHSIIHGKTDVVSLLLKYMPPDVAEAVLAMRFGERERSHFHLTVEAKENALDLIDCFCKRMGADVDKDVDGEGNSLLHLFIRDRSEEDVEGLLKLSATYECLNMVNEKNLAGRYPLHLAVLARSERIVSALLEAGADVNTKDQTHHTPLHLAVLDDCSKEMVTIFLDADGTKIDAVTKIGESALDIAYTRENTPLQDLLASRGAQRMHSESDYDDDEGEDEDEADVAGDTDEEEEEEEKAVDEVDQCLPCISWEEMKGMLTEKLTNEEFQVLASHLDVSPIQLRLFSKTEDKCSYFFVIVKESSANQLPSALNQIGKSDLAALARRLCSA